MRITMPTNTSIDTPTASTDTQAPMHKVHICLALDYGVKKMGVAMGNSLTKDGAPFDILVMHNGQPDWDDLLNMIHQWRVHTVIIGAPMNMDDTISPLYMRAKKFARRLLHRLCQDKRRVSVYLMDERLSSWQARQMVKDFGKNASDDIDDVAAYLILQSYFAAPNLAKKVGSDA